MNDGERPLPVSEDYDRVRPEGRVRGWWFDVKERLLARRIQMIDMMDGGEFSDEAMGRFGEVLDKQGLKKRTALVLVHPLFYGQNEMVNDVGELREGYRAYVDSMGKLIRSSVEKGIPVILFASSPKTISDERDVFSNNVGKYRGGGYEPRIQELLMEQRRMLQEVFGVDRGEVFVVVTEPGSPDPLVDGEFMNRVFNEPQKFATEEELRGFYGEDYSVPEKFGVGSKYLDYIQLVMGAFWKRMVDSNQPNGPRLERVLLAGSYFGGQRPGKEMAIRKEVGEDDGKRVYEYEVTAGTYMHPDDEEVGLWGIDSRRYLRGERKDHPLDHISVRGCAAYLMRYMYQAGLSVGISDATFPMKLPRIADIGRIEHDAAGRHVVTRRR